MEGLKEGKDGRKEGAGKVGNEGSTGARGEEVSERGGGDVCYLRQGHSEHL